jgi:CubicO group peptidase (beta-lactamase class C family)
VTAAPDWLDELAIGTFNECTLAGLAVGVVRDGRLERFVGLGLADAERDRPVDAGTAFRIASISKTMTAIGVLQLVEEGRLGLDDPVNDRLATLRVEARAGDAPPVTVRHLLTHTAGIGELRRWTDLVRPMVALAGPAGRPPAPLSEYYARPLRAEVAAGTKWAYANHGYGILGQLIEDLRGAPFAAVMRERIFAPLGMEHTDFARGERVRDRIAVGYALRRGRMQPVKDRDVAIPPAGSCWSTVEDMARYVAALAGGGPPLVRPETLEAMLASQGEADARLPAMGLGFFLERLGGRRVAAHDGAWTGFISSMLVAPDDGVGVVAFTNTQVAFAPHVVAERILRRLLDLPEPAAPVVAERPHLWPELVGVYRPARGLNTNLRVWPLIGGEVQVAVRRGHLVARAASPVKPLRKGLRLHAAAPDDPLLFEARHEDLVLPVAFERDAQGRVAAARTGTTRGGFLRVRRRPRATSFRLWGRIATGAGTAGAGAAAVALCRRRR